MTLLIKDGVRDGFNNHIIEENKEGQEPGAISPIVQSPFESLPVEILFKIVGDLTQQEWKVLKLVSKRMNQVSEGIEKTLKTENQVVLSLSFRRFFASHPHAPTPFYAIESSLLRAVELTYLVRVQDLMIQSNFNGFCIDGISRNSLTTLQLNEIFLAGIENKNYELIIKIAQGRRKHEISLENFTRALKGAFEQNHTEAISVLARLEQFNRISQEELGLFFVLQMNRNTEMNREFTSAFIHHPHASPEEVGSIFQVAVELNDVDMAITIINSDIEMSSKSLGDAFFHAALNNQIEIFNALKKFIRLGCISNRYLSSALEHVLYKDDLKMALFLVDAILECPENQQEGLLRIFEEVCGIRKKLSGTIPVVEAFLNSSRFKTIEAKNFIEAFVLATKENHKEIMDVFMSGRFVTFSAIEFGQIAIRAAQCYLEEEFRVLMKYEEFQQIAPEDLGVILGEICAKSRDGGIVEAIAEIEQFRHIPKQYIENALVKAAENSRLSMVEILIGSSQFQEIDGKVLELILETAINNKNVGLLQVLKNVERFDGFGVEDSIQILKGEPSSDQIEDRNAFIENDQSGNSSGAIENVSSFMKSSLFQVGLGGVLAMAISSFYNQLHDIVV